jgi:hypothetical protein
MTRTGEASPEGSEGPCIWEVQVLALLWLNKNVFCAGSIIEAKFTRTVWS